MFFFLFFFQKCIDAFKSGYFLSLNMGRRLSVFRTGNTRVAEKLEIAAPLSQTVIRPTPSCRLSCATEHELIVLPNNAALVTFSTLKIAKVRATCWVTLTTGCWDGHSGDSSLQKKRRRKTPKYGILEASCLWRDHSVSSPRLSVCTNVLGVWTLTPFKRTGHLSGLH